MKKVVEFKVERRMVKVLKNRKWLFSYEYENTPMWCLVKYTSGIRYELDIYGHCDPVDYHHQEVLLKSQDEDCIKQEFKNFTEGLK